MSDNQAIADAHHVLSVRKSERQFTVLKPTLSDSPRNGSFVPRPGGRCSKTSPSPTFSDYGSLSKCRQADF
jgi:hypothetical protein